MKSGDVGAGELNSPNVSDSAGNAYTQIGFTTGMEAGSLEMALAIFWCPACLASTGTNTVTFSCAMTNNNPIFALTGLLAVTIEEMSGFISPVSHGYNAQTRNTSGSLSVALTDSTGTAITSALTGPYTNCLFGVADFLTGGVDYFISALATSQAVGPPEPVPVVTGASWIYSLAQLATFSGTDGLRLWIRGTPVALAIRQRGNIDWDQTGPDARQGEYYGVKFQYADGTFTTGNVPKFLTDGTLTDSGVAAAGLGGSSVIPAGTLDGTNKTFTLATAPAGPLLLFLNGVEQLEGTDYTLSGTAITYTVAPKADDWQKAFY